MIHNRRTSYTEISLPQLTNNLLFSGPQFPPSSLFTLDITLVLHRRICGELPSSHCMRLNHSGVVIGLVYMSKSILRVSLVIDVDILLYLY